MLQTNSLQEIGQIEGARMDELIRSKATESSSVVSPRPRWLIWRERVNMAGELSKWMSTGRCT